jgi:hypothetical protein
LLVSADDQILAALPEPPPPRPDRRQMAIEEAMRTFDGVEARADQPRAASVRTPLRTLLARPQVAAFATVLLVALVSVPVWLSIYGPRERPAAEEAASPARRARPPATQLAAAPIPALPPVGMPGAGAMTPPVAPLAERADASNAMVSSPPAPVAPPPPQLAQASVSQPMAGAPADDAFAKSSVAGSDFAANTPVAQARLAQKDKEDERPLAIVVTGSRAERPTPLRQVGSASLAVSGASKPTADAWNACTVLDPRRNLRACRDVLNPGQPGATGRATAQLADGLTAAWKGDLDGALKAFDRAAATAPDMSFAFLNRALAYQQQGDKDRALADLDRAIVRDPDSASAYYHRSLLLREMGDTARADADAKRARQLDPHNAGVLSEPGGD